MTTDKNNSYKKRIEQAMTYYLTQGETPNYACELAIEQIKWEESQGEENCWKGSNDSLPIFPFAC